MSFLNKAREQAQKSMGGVATAEPKVNVPKVKVGPTDKRPPMPPMSKGAPRIPGKPGSIPRPPMPKKKDIETKNEGPLEKKNNPFKQPITEVTNNEEPVQQEIKEETPVTVTKEEKTIETTTKETSQEETVKEKEESKEQTTEETKSKTENPQETEEEKKEEKKETKKKKTRKSKKKDVEENTEELTAIKDLPSTEMDYAEAINLIGLSFEDPEWETFKEDVTKRHDEIIINSDMTPAAIQETIANLCSLRDSIGLKYSETKTIYDNIAGKEPEGLIERTKKLNAVGSNAEERKYNSIMAVINYKDNDGRNINLFELLEETRKRYNFLNYIINSIAYKQNILVTMLGALKLEK